jgi:hypothetical protein
VKGHQKSGELAIGRLSNLTSCALLVVEETMGDHDEVEPGTYKIWISDDLLSTVYDGEPAHEVITRKGGCGRPRLVELIDVSRFG